MTGAYNNLKLCSYLFAADTYDNNNKIFDGFIPLIEIVLLHIDKKSIVFNDLQNTINEVYSINIPKTTLDNLLRTLKAMGKIKYERSIIYIIGEMLDAQYFDKRDKKEKELDELFWAYREHLLSNEVIISIDEAKQSICTYIFTHCFDLANFIGIFQKPDMSVDESKSHITYLCDFLMDCKSNNKPLYDAFLRLYKGAVQTTLLNFNPDKMEDLNEMDLNIRTVILDSNFIMRLIDIQTTLEFQMASETIKYLHNKKVDLIVLPQTIEEICSSIKFYLNESAPYVASTAEYFKHQSIRMSGFVSAEQRGKTRTYFFELSKQENLKEILENRYKICVLEDLEFPEFMEDDIQSLIRAKNRDGYGKTNAIHDLSLIHYCQLHREKNVSTFKAAKCWVLTNDIKLTYWNQQNKSNIQECITEAQLSNLIWLQTPKDDNAGLTNTIVTLANGEYISSSKLYSFIDKMQLYKDTIKNSPNEVDNLSLIFACDCIKTEDVQRIVNDEGNDTDYIIAQKVENIKKRNEEKELVLRQSHDENARLNLELKLTRLKLKNQELNNEMQELNNSTANIYNKINQFKFDKDSLPKIKKIKEKWGRVLSLVSLSLIIFTLYLIFSLPSIITPFIFEICNRFEQYPEWIKGNLLSIIISLLMMFISGAIYCLIGIAKGLPMNPLELFKDIRDRLSKRTVKKRNMCTDFINQDFDKKKIELQDSINQESKLLVPIKEKLQETKLMLLMNEKEINELSKVVIH